MATNELELFLLIFGTDRDLDSDELASEINGLARSVRSELSSQHPSMTVEVEPLGTQLLEDYVQPYAYPHGVITYQEIFGFFVDKESAPGLTRRAFQSSVESHLFTLLEKWRERLSRLTVILRYHRQRSFPVYQLWNGRLEEIFESYGYLIEKHHVDELINDAMDREVSPAFRARTLLNKEGWR